MRNNVSSFWAGEMVNDLKRMWAAGRSGSDIAAAIGTTRCAVLGKIYRLDLGRTITSAGQVRRPRKTPEEIEATKREKEKRRRDRRRSQRVTFVRVKPVNLEALRCVEVIPQHKSLLELDADGCRFPFGDGPFTFCNHTQHEGSSYCGPHMALSRRRMS